MDLILWRHAKAADWGRAGMHDASRKLTPKGFKQARRMGAWLRTQLPADYLLIVSPALRAQQTALELSKKFRTDAALAPSATAADILKAAGWPAGKRTVVVVGHQPQLGAALALALTGKAERWEIKKGGIWWLGSDPATRKTSVLAMITPRLL